MDSDDDAATLSYAFSKVSAGLTATSSKLEYNGIGYDYLGAGETEFLTADVIATDRHGAVSNTETIILQVNGENDAVEITAEDLVGAVTEDATDPTLTESGTIAFEDVDLTDVHTIGATFLSTTHNGQLGDMTAMISNAATGDGVGEVTWNFTLTNDDVQFLGAGDTITETYRLTLTDNKGSTVTRDVAVTTTGVNDAAIIGGQSTGAVIEDTITSTNGILTVSDLDQGEDAFVAGNFLGSYGFLNLSGGGNWTYFLNNGLTAVQNLNSGQSLIDTVTIQTLDGTTQDIDLAISGVDEGLIGKQLEYQYLFPSGGQTFGGAQDFVVGSGVEIVSSPT